MSISSTTSSLKRAREEELSSDLSTKRHQSAPPSLQDNLLHYCKVKKISCVVQELLFQDCSNIQARIDSFFDHPSSIKKPSLFESYKEKIRIINDLFITIFHPYLLITQIIKNKALFFRRNNQATGESPLTALSLEDLSKWLCFNKVRKLSETTFLLSYPSTAKKILQQALPNWQDRSSQEMLHFERGDYNELEGLNDFVDGLPISDICKRKISRQISLSFFRKNSSLHLENCGIKELPLGLKQLTHIEKLNLSGNNLQRLPYWLGLLIHLRSLHLGKNQFTRFPPVICSFLSLQELYITDNFIPDLPSNLTALTQLKVLDISSNLISSLLPFLQQLKSLESFSFKTQSNVQLPFWMTKWKNLKVLHIGGSPDLESLPKVVASLTSLEELHLEQCSIKELPEGFQHLKKLKKLHCRFLPSFPTRKLFEKVRTLPHLEELHLVDCGIDEVDPSIGELKQLKVLNLEHNCLKTLPLEQLHTLPLQTLITKDNISLSDNSLRESCSSGYLSLTTLLLDSMGSSISQVAINDAFIKAFENDHMNLVKLCINHRVASRFLLHTTKEKALQLAVKNKKREIIPLLLQDKKVSVQQATIDTFTLGDKDTLHLLMQSDQYKEEWEETLYAGLTQALENGHIHLLKFCMETHLSQWNNLDTHNLGILFFQSAQDGIEEAITLFMRNHRWSEVSAEYLKASFTGAHEKKRYAILRMLFENRRVEEISESTLKFVLSRAFALKELEVIELYQEQPFWKELSLSFIFSCFINALKKNHVRCLESLLTNPRWNELEKAYEKQILKEMKKAILADKRKIVHLALSQNFRSRVSEKFLREIKHYLGILWIQSVRDKKEDLQTLLGRFFHLIEVSRDELKLFDPEVQLKVRSLLQQKKQSMHPLWMKTVQAKNRYF